MIWVNAERIYPVKLWLRFIPSSRKRAANVQQIPTDSLGAGEPDSETLFLLSVGMAQRHGVNLSAAMQQGILNRTDLAQMLVSCLKCPGTHADCQDLQKAPEPEIAAPDWCANIPVLESLRDLV